ncbi:MAG: DUF3810 domain-containing protein [Oscillospiraceae bacterium]|nr:DUF3810 domain-containing protein [Oscillospiraceae bacterium]
MRKRRSPEANIRLAVILAECAFPVVLLVLFYALRANKDFMARTQAGFAEPVRGFLGKTSSVLPFSLMELLCAAAVIWVLYTLIRMIAALFHERDKLKTLLSRLLKIAIPALYIWCAFCWLWNVGYHAPGFAEKSGFANNGVSVIGLSDTARLFAEKANEYAPLVARDADGYVIGDTRLFLSSAVNAYDGLAQDFPCLAAQLRKPKPMLFSRLMSRTGYTGVYFALTGESNVNTHVPRYTIPSTATHELAHQCGVFYEAEANFVAVVACVRSEDPAFAYSGYMLGLSHLLNALYEADRDAWQEVYGTLCPQILFDRAQSHEYWRSQETFDTGIRQLDRFLEFLTNKTSGAVTSVYDSYLRSNNQELGVRSYGACVDLLVEYFGKDTNR